MHELGWYLIPAGLVAICAAGMYAEAAITDWIDERRRRNRG
jgi:hypothetical protein